MSEKDIDGILRNAAQRTRTSVSPDPAPVLEAMGPRLRRARAAHRTRIAGGMLATLLVVGLGLLAIRPQSPDDTGGVAATTSTPVVTATPETPTAAPVSTPEDPTPSVGPEASASPTEQPSSTAEATPDPTPEPTGNAETTSTPDPGPSQAGVVTHRFEAGEITVSYDSSTGMELPPELDTGWDVEFEKLTAEVVKIELTDGSTVIEVEIEMEDGRPSFRVEHDQRGESSGPGPGQD